MDRNSINWKGFWPASPTPFDSKGQLDLVRFGQLIDWYLSQGVHGLFVNGTTGEWFSQTKEERMEVADFAVKRVAGQVPVVIGVTTFTARESSELGVHAMSIGADGICSSAPAYAKTLPDETVAYFEELGTNVGAPLMIYNWPHGTSIEIADELANRIADLEYVVAFKDSTSDGAQFKETTRNLINKVRIFGNFMLPSTLDFMMEVGGDGTIGGGTIYGTPDPLFYENFWSGNLTAALEHAKENEVLQDRLWLPGGFRGKWGAYQSQLKLIMKLIGQPGGEVRPPRLPISNVVAIDEIRTILQECGIKTVS
jgi:dihydrodipicolinate synthase/N-acetylneuraminate lyase